jgi:hypothetical protein
MSTVKTVERQIRRTEGFDAHILHPDGRDVRSDRDHMPSYPFTRKASGTSTVADWRRTRFHLRYPGFDVVVVDGRGDIVHGSTLLRTVRATYR